MRVIAPPAGVKLSLEAKPLEMDRWESSPEIERLFVFHLPFIIIIYTVSAKDSSSVSPKGTSISNSGW